MVGASVAVRLVAWVRTPQQATIGSAANTVSGPVIARERSATYDLDFPHEQDQIVRTNWPDLSTARELDKSAIEYRDVFRMRPVMPLHTDRDPSSLQKRFEAENLPYKGIDWELEDLLPESFHKAFVQACPDAIAKVTTAGGKTHRDLTRDGKARFHRFVKENAVHADLKGLIATLRALRFYLGMPAL